MDLIIDNGTLYVKVRHYKSLGSRLVNDRSWHNHLNINYISEKGNIDLMKGRETTIDYIKSLRMGIYYHYEWGLSMF